MNHYIAPTLRLERIEVRLWNAPTYVPFAGPAWWDFAPNRLGIYALWNRSENPIYVGESSNLQERIRYNLGSPKNHTFPSQIQNRNNQLRTAAQIREYIRTRYAISCIDLSFGRAEAEEYLVTLWRTYTANRFNSPIPRRWRCDT